MPEVHRPQNGIIDLVPTVIQHGSQNLHDEVQMAGQNEWLRGVPFGHVQQSLTLWLVVTLKLWMLPSPRKYFYSCCIFQIILFCKHNLACTLIVIHFIQCTLLSNWLYHFAFLSGPTWYCQSRPTWYHLQA